jgi:O-antigen ligase/Tfp pilus assembly protein PilF
LASDSQEKSSRRPALSVREKLDRWCERGILAVVLAILVLGPLAFGATEDTPDGYSSPHFYGLVVIEGLTALALALWAGRFYAQRGFRLLWPPICWAVLAFVAYAIVRCHLAEIEYAGRQELRKVVLYAALFFVVVNNLNRRESATTVAVALIGLGMGESLLGFYQFVTHSHTIWGVVRPVSRYGIRGGGTYINPDHLAGLVEMILPLALAYTVMGRLSATMKVLLGYSALVMMAGVVASESRGGLAAMAVTLAVFCVVLLFQPDYWRRGALALAAMGLAGVVLMQQFGSVKGRFDQLVTGEGDSRSVYWQAAEQIFHQHILWGAGPGHYKFLYPKYILYEGLYGQHYPRYAHNDYLNTLCEWGLAGFGIIIAAVGLVYAGVWRIWPYVRRTSNELGRKESSKAAFVLGASLGLLAILIHSEVDFNMQIPANAIIAITFMALLSAHWRFGTERYWVNPGRVGKVLLAAVTLGVAGYLAVEGTQLGREYYWLQRGLTERSSRERQLAALKKAYQIEPGNYLTQHELGECYRLEAFEGEPGNEALARQAMKWLEGAMDLNPYAARALIGYGLCLDWLDRPKEAAAYFIRANELNPYNSVVSFFCGWHCVNVGNYPLAKHWFEACLGLPEHQKDAEGYLEMVNERLAQAAKTGQAP